MPGAVSGLDERYGIGFSGANAAGSDFQSVTNQHWVAGRWQNNMRTLTKTDSTGHPIENVNQSWAGGWRNHHRELYEYNASGKVTKYLSQLWGTADWVNNTQILYVYDGGGNQVGTLTQSWSGRSWQDTERTLNTCDPSGLPVLTVTQYWNGYTWINFRKVDIEWASTEWGSPARETNAEWESGAGEWVYTNQKIYTYAFTWYYGEILYQSWAPESRKWMTSLRRTFSYSGNSVEDLSTAWNDTGWTNYALDISTYIGSDLRYISNILTKQWDGSAWVDNRHSSYTYDGDMRTLEAVYQYSISNKWINTSRYLYRYGSILAPQEDNLWIAGEQDTIKWKNLWPGKTLDIEYSTDCGTTFTPVATGVAGNDCSYTWDIPPELLSQECTVKILDAGDGTDLAESDQFKMKPYILTKKYPSTGDLIAYDMSTDRWGFGNTQAEMFPPTWYSQFDYQGIDPFTKSPYPQNLSDGVFASAKTEDFPDWVSWVGAFTPEACYWSRSLGLYSPTAVARWQEWKGPWGGSCFGIAMANALAFSRRVSFQNHYPDVGPFGQPIEVAATDGVRSEVNELFTHQYGDPHRRAIVGAEKSKTPSGTVADLKAMFREEDVPLRVLMLFRNGPDPGGHVVLPYELKRFEGGAPGSFKVRIWDNSNPTDTTLYIQIDSAALGGHGYWEYPRWPGWGGYWRLFLADALEGYLAHPVFPRKAGEGSKASPFSVDSSELQIYARTAGSVLIRDSQGNTTGFTGDSVVADIPGSAPLIAVDGSRGRPYGYVAPVAAYSLTLGGFPDSLARLTVATGNRTLTVARRGARASQTDRYFYDGGISVTNPDSVAKSITLMSIINRPSDERVYILRSLRLAQRDSVRIENPDEERLELSSTGTVTTYDLELNDVSEARLAVFEKTGIPIESHSSHTLVPDWTDLDGSRLMILVDRGDDGSVDDTLWIQDEATGTEPHGSLLPEEYRLYQNYPNPFNPITTIRYALPRKSAVHLAVFSMLGQEVATLVRGEEEAGYHEVTFDGSGLGSGIYFCRITAGEFVQTLKMALVK